LVRQASFRSCRHISHRPTEPYVVISTADPTDPSLPLGIGRLVVGVTGLDEAGSSFERTFEGFDAVVLHHEIDHLEGVLFIDRVATPEDLYTIVENDDGERVRVPFRDVATK